MQFAHLLRHFQTTTFRLTLVIATLFAVCVGVLFLTVDWYVIGTLQAEIKETVSARLAAITQGHKQSPAIALTRDMTDTLEQEPGAYALLRGPDGERLAGNLATSVQPEGW